MNKDIYRKNKMHDEKLASKYTQKAWRIGEDSDLSDVDKVDQIEALVKEIEEKDEFVASGEMSCVKQALWAMSRTIYEASLVKYIA